MNVKIIDKTGKFIIYDKRNTLLITADMAQAGKLAELIFFAGILAAPRGGGTWKRKDSRVSSVSGSGG